MLYGDIYTALSYTEEALIMFRRAYDISQKLLGEKNERTIQIKGKIEKVYQWIKGHTLATLFPVLCIYQSFNPDELNLKNTILCEFI